MTTNNGSSSSDKPNVPKPTEPTTTRPQNVITEGQKPTSQQAFNTDGKKPK